MPIGYHAVPELIANSDSVVYRGPDFLNWLLDDHARETKLFYDLDAAVAAILKSAGVSRLDGEKLAKKRRLYLRGTGFRLTYYPGKFFGVDFGGGVGRRFANFANAAEYHASHFEADTSPAYVVAKAREARETGVEVAQAFQSLGLPADSLVSPVSAFLKKYPHIDFVTIDDIPEAVAELAFQAVRGVQMEAYTLGYFPRAFDYDLSGAFGWAMTQLLDPRRGTWSSGPNRPVAALYGFCEGKITCHAAFHPFLTEFDDTSVYTPVGSWPCVLTLQEIDFLERYRLGRFDIARGYWWIPDAGQPGYHYLEGLMRWLWGKRQQKTGMERQICKKLSVSLWGRMLATVGPEGEEVFGELFNPVAGAMVETLTRLRVASTLLDHGIKPLHVSVDGFISDELLPLDFADQLGAWRLNAEGRCVIASAGAVAFEGKSAPQEFALDFDWLRQQIEANPKASEYTKRRLSVVSLHKALATDFAALGNTEEIQRSVTLGDHKRMWRGRPRSFGTLLKRRVESAPLHYDVIAGLAPLGLAEVEGKEVDHGDTGSSSQTKREGGIDNGKTDRRAVDVAGEGS